MRLVSTRNEINQDPVKFIGQMRRYMNIMLNQVFISSSGDIMYFAGGGIIP
jgi:acyl-homoserine lactone acylase PvdQ